MSEKYLAYLDESGDPDFNEKASSLFFIGATLLKETAYECIHEAYNKILRDNNLVHLKSSRITSFKQRINIIEEIVKLDIDFLIY